MILTGIEDKCKQGKKIFALLIDPDKHSDESLKSLISVANSDPGPDFLLVGGSIVLNGIDRTIQLIKSLTKKPVVLFPGNALQFSAFADGILFLSLISGRNPEFLIGNHVLAGPKIKKSGIEVIPTGYLLINSGVDTSVSYMSNTQPIPYLKNDIAMATAIAGEMLGLKLIYLEAGSGATRPVATEMIKAVKSNITIPLIVGGGIKSTEQLKTILEAGADIIVIGTAAETNKAIVSEFASVFKQYNQL